MGEDEARIDERRRTARPDAGDIDLFEGDILLLRFLGLGAGKIENLRLSRS